MYIPWYDLMSALGLEKENTAEPSESSRPAFVKPSRLSQWLIPHDIPFRYSLYAFTRQLRAFQPKVRLFIVKEPYLIKTVESSWELEEALRLRYRVFHHEWLGKSGPESIDVDAYDFQADHLIIINRKTGRIVGTYRLISSSYSKAFYSSQEFNLTSLLSRPGVKLELGRACIEPAFRNGLTLVLLWKGIHAYISEINASYCFGCSSIQTTDPLKIIGLVRYFQKAGYLTSRYAFPVQPAYRIPFFQVSEPVIPETPSDVPALLDRYLRAGARVSAEPALDCVFRCVDFMTVLETAQLQSNLHRRLTTC